MSAETQLEKIRSELDMERMRTKLAVADLSRLEAVVRKTEEQLQSLQTEVALGRSEQRVLWDSHVSVSTTCAQQAKQLREFLTLFHAGIGSEQQQFHQTRCVQQGQFLEQSALRWPGSGEQVQRLGRFTVFAPSNDIESPHVAETALDNSPLHTETPELSGVNLEEVHTMLASTNRQVGALFEKMHAHVLDVMSAHGLPRERAVKSSNGNSGFNLSDSASVASSQHPSVSAASLGVSSSHLVEADEVLNLWETLGKPIERTTKRNRALEDENQKLKTEIALRMQKLQELQHRAAQTQTQAQAVSPDGGASTRSSTRASTPTRRSAVSTSVLVTASASSASLGNSGPPAHDEAALPSSGTGKSSQAATGFLSSSCVLHAESSAATQGLLAPVAHPQVH